MLNVFMPNVAILLRLALLPRTWDRALHLLTAGIVRLVLKLHDHVCPMSLLKELN